MKNRIPLILGCSLLVIAGIALAIPGDPLLMTGAVRAVSFPPGYYFGGVYRWLNARELLAVAQSRDMVEEGPYYGFPYSVLRIKAGSPHYSVVPLPKELGRVGCDWVFSPNGKRLLVQTMDTNSETAEIQGYSYYLCSIDGKAELVHNGKSDGVPSNPFAWLPDGRRWVDLADWEGVVRVRDLSARPITRQLPGPVLHSPLLITESPASELQSYGGDTVTDSILCGIWDPDSGRSRQRRIPSPIRSRVIDISVSPDGKNLAWILWVREVSWVKSQIRRIPFCKSVDPIADSFQLWVTDLSGQRAKCVGTKPIRATWDTTPTCFAPGWRYDGGFKNLEWLPDSSAVSFVLDDSIYAAHL